MANIGENWSILARVVVNIGEKLEFAFVPVAIVVECVYGWISAFKWCPYLHANFTQRYRLAVLPRLAHQIAHGGDLTSALALGKTPVRLALAFGMGVLDDRPLRLAHGALHVLGGVLHVSGRGGRQGREGDLRVALALAAAARLGDVAERADQTLKPRVEARDPVRKRIHPGVRRAPGEDEMPQLRDGVGEGWRIEALLQLADEVARGELQLAHLAGVVGVRVEKGAEQFGAVVVALAPVPRAEAANGADQLDVVVDDRLHSRFERAYEHDSGESGVVDRLRTVEGEGSCI